MVKSEIERNHRKPVLLGINHGGEVHDTEEAMLDEMKSDPTLFESWQAVRRELDALPPKSLIYVERFPETRFHMFSAIKEFGEQLGHEVKPLETPLSFRRREGYAQLINELDTMHDSEKRVDGTYSRYFVEDMQKRVAETFNNPSLATITEPELKLKAFIHSQIASNIMLTRILKSKRRPALVVLGAAHAQDIQAHLPGFMDKTPPRILSWVKEWNTEDHMNFPEMSARLKLRRDKLVRSLRREAAK